ncbi:MAG: hypothetical protein DI556_13090 [Rhodovulum sulfidophilum]|uniref:ParB-like N-terminal domain-containing protein n=1 Tax=Rhodovulum sulfidophilum TaxID=35806 RepID=A0A2W5PVF2_RHOSU|nr:MAG: hypothetical protein DI556_13090 [Rhodovulum sulfidophilum]
MNAIRAFQDHQNALPLFSLDQLLLDDLNPRREHDDEALAALAESIRVCGLVQNLGGRLLGDGRIGIVAGGRRLAALTLLAGEGFEVGPVPVALAASEEIALLWSQAENAAREALRPAEEILAYRRLTGSGRSFADIAKAFGVTEAHVARRMKLAGLSDDVLAALRAGDLTLDQAAAFTVAPSEEAALALLERVRGDGYWRAESIRRELTGEGAEARDRIAKFVTLEDYRAAGGAVEGDLFSEAVYLRDKPLLERLAAEKIAAIKARITEVEGWLWAEYVDDSVNRYTVLDKFDGMPRAPGDLTEAEATEYDTLSERSDNGDDLDPDEEARLEALADRLDGTHTEGQRAVGGVLFWIGYDGTVERRDGLVRAEDRAVAVEAGYLRDGAGRSGGDASVGAGEPEGPVFSGALSADIGRVRLGATQVTLLREPAILTDMLAYVLSGAAGQHAGTFLDLTLGAPEVQPEKPGAYELPEALASREAMDFAAFRALPDADRRASLLAGIARLVCRGWRDRGATLEVIAAEIGVDPREVWRPDAENFFGRVTVPYLDATIRDLLDWTDETPAFAEFRKLKKKDKAAILEGLFAEGSPVRTEYAPTPEQIARIDHWMPET